MALTLLNHEPRPMDMVSAPTLVLERVTVSSEICMV
jgi:hypothetical protein